MRRFIPSAALLFEPADGEFSENALDTFAKCGAGSLPASTESVYSVYVADRHVGVRSRVRIGGEWE
jgi:hypothetical protein